MFFANAEYNDSIYAYIVAIIAWYTMQEFIIYSRKESTL